MVINFGRNIRFTPRSRYRPRSEEEILRILDEHRDGTVRAIGAGHSWNPGIESPDALVDLRHLRRIRVHQSRTRVNVGAGVMIGALLKHLSKRDLTLPSIGLIDRQTVAGAVATGTHGSGRPSMSHYVQSLRIACYGADGGAVVRTVDSGRALRAARCAVGAMGIVLEVTLPCVPQYYVREKSVWRSGLDAALAAEADAPLQQLYLIPHSWRLLAHERRVDPRNRRRGLAPLYRVYWFSVIDVLLHLGLKLSASLLRSRRLIHLLYRRFLPACLVPRWRVTDRSDRQLLMRHELFRHLEMEVFVRRARLGEGLEFVGEVLQAVDDGSGEVSATTRGRIERLGLSAEFEELRGSYVHHYPICVRRVQPDDTLISMSSCDGIEADDWYAISFITFVEPREPFQRVARMLATVMSEDFGARLHWGKWFPLGAAAVERNYPGMPAFKAVCEEFDPRAVFRNGFLRETIFHG